MRFRFTNKRLAQLAPGPSWCIDGGQLRSVGERYLVDAGWMVNVPWLEILMTNH